MFKVRANQNDPYEGVTKDNIYTVRRIRHNLGVLEFLIFNDNKKWIFVKACCLDEEK